MICAQKFLSEASHLGFNVYTGVPCSFLKPLINASIESNHLSYIPAVNEGDAVGIAAGWGSSRFHLRFSPQLEKRLSLYQNLRILIR